MAEDTDFLRDQLAASLKNRALFYLEIYRVLDRELGQARAAELLSEAIRTRGCAVGARFREFAPADFAGLRDAFLSSIPDEGRPFDPDVIACDANGLEIRLRRCPLKEAWQEAGLDDAAIATMCRIAGTVDNGTFESAGFAFSSHTWEPGREGCCHMVISKRPSGDAS
jgi:hypothetical protein